MSDTHCINCGRRYTRSARPEWAFDAAYQLMGTVHVSCANQWARHNGVGANHFSKGDSTSAQGAMWFYESGLNTDSRYSDIRVAMLFTEPGRNATRHIEYWREQGQEINDADIEAWAELVKELDARFGRQLGVRAE